MTIASRQNVSWRSVRPPVVLFAALIMVACAPGPGPAPTEPPAVPRVPAPGLVTAQELAGKSLALIAEYHVDPVAEGELQNRLIRQLSLQLDHPAAVAPPATPLAARIEALHTAAPSRKILPAMDAALGRVVRGLGSDSVYYDRAQFALLQRDPADMANIGITVSEAGGRILISEVSSGTPADRAGLRPGDELLAIDGQSLSGLAHEQVMTRLYGDPGSALALRVRFVDGDSREIRLQREVPPAPPVEGHWLRGGIAYVRLRTLTTSTLQEFNETFLGLIRKQRAPRALVLDLRHNRGGLLDSAVQLTELFLAGGTILSVQERTEGRPIRYQAQPRSRVLEQDLPLAVLIDAETASGAESIAAALQDHHRALIVGQTSQGSGMVYKFFPLPAERGLKLATGRLYRPDGAPLTGEGVVPDVCLHDGRVIRMVRRTEMDCPRDPGRDTSGTDPVLDEAARILADRALYQQLLGESAPGASTQ